MPGGIHLFFRQFCRTFGSKFDGEDCEEDTSYARVTADANDTPLALDDALCQRQTESRPQNRSSTIQLLEIGEQAWNVSVWNAGACVLHFDAKGAAALPAGADLDGAGLDCELNGV